MNDMVALRKQEMEEAIERRDFSVLLKIFNTLLAGHNELQAQVNRMEQRQMEFQTFIDEIVTNQQAANQQAAATLAAATAAGVDAKAANDANTVQNQTVEAIRFLAQTTSDNLVLVTANLNQLAKVLADNGIAVPTPITSVA